MRKVPAGFRTIAWEDGAVVMIDQRKLPVEEVYFRAATWQDVTVAIRDMIIRGAPAIGIAAAMGVALAARQTTAHDVESLREALEPAFRGLAETRPTAVNLFWALERMRAVLRANDGAAGVEAVRARLLREAEAVKSEDLAMCRAMGDLGAALLPGRAKVLTHCNAGGLATAGYGTALGVIRSGWREGRVELVYADETRPFLQGARLTAWELHRDGIPTRVVTDNMAGHLMQRGRIDAIVVGTDRIAANGDIANKIGTYPLAVVARAHAIPFYVAGPTSTIDMATATGRDIPIECRPTTEVTHIGGHRIVPEGVDVENPAFDVTPAEYVTAIVTERGVIQPPSKSTVAELMTRDWLPSAVGDDET